MHCDQGSQQDPGLIACNECVHDAFNTTAFSQVDDVAVEAWDGNLTYGELRKLANQLAAVLIKKRHHHGHDEAIGFMLEKSKWAVVTVLAILSAGGACVAMSTSLPPGRLESIGSTSGMRMVITNSKMRDTADILLKESNIEVIAIDFERLPCTETDVVLPAVQTHRAAYMLFTSGSTGTPKGICVDHVNLRSSISSHGPAWGIQRGTRVFQFSSFTFDVSVADIFTTLVCGGCICMPSESERIQDLAHAIQRYRANWAFLTPSVAGNLEPAEVPGLKTLVLGGEAASRTLVDRWTKADDFTLRICWGPAEGTIYATGTDPLKSGSDPLNIGQPLPGSCIVSVMNPENLDDKVENGSVGELVITGPIVARGYIGTHSQGGFRAAADRRSDGEFVEVERRSRSFRTGDLGLVNPDGSINIIGRKDSQVKIRGQRVELREIEHSLAILFPEKTNNCPIRILAHLYKDELESQILAFIEEKQSQAEIEELRFEEKFLPNIEELHRSLPEYMIPTALISVNKLPLTINGKTDYKKLDVIYRELLDARRHECAARLRPLSIKERALMDAIEIEKPEKRPNFQTDLSFVRNGGDSVRALATISRLRKGGWELDFRLLMCPTSLRDVASQLTIPQDRTKFHLDLPPFSLCPQVSPVDEIRRRCASICNVDAETVEDIYPATGLQEELLASSHTRNTSSYVSRYEICVPAREAPRLMRAWEAVYQHWPILRTRIVYLGGRSGCLQVVVRDAPPWKDFLDENLECPEEQKLTYGGRLHSASLVRSQSDSGSPPKGFVKMIWSPHHAIVDAALLERIKKSLVNAYESKPLEPNTSYGLYVSYIMKCRGVALEWWKQYLRDAETCVWPSKYEKPTQVRSITRETRLPNRLSLESTMATCLTAAWAILISKYSSQQDVLFATARSGRFIGMDGSDSIAGPTVCTTPFRLKLKDTETIAELLARLQTELIDMALYETVSTRELIEKDIVEVDLSRLSSLLIVQTLSATSTSGHGLSFRESRQVQVDSFPISMECVPKVTGWKLVLDYQQNAIPEVFAQDILSHFVLIAEKLCSPSCSEHSLKETLCLDTWGAEHLAKEPKKEEEGDIITAFLARANKFPKAKALHSSDTTIDYSDLDKISSRVAFLLKRDLHVVEGDLVFICCAKSINVVIAMLAILKAGAAFVPLDGSQPRARIESLQAKVIARATITDADRLTLFEGSSQSVYVLQSIIHDSHATTIQYAHSADINPASLAYVMFTSGTTGIPKAVQIEHRALYISAMTRASSIQRTELSRVYQFSAYTFDTSIEDIFTTLLSGGCICVPMEHERRSELPASFCRLKANTFDLTPSLAGLLHPTDFKGLKTLILGGEAISRSLLHKWVTPGLDVFNTYGPTEACIVVSSKRISSVEDDSNDIGQFSTGRPVIVHPDDHHQLVPRGGVGELLVESQTLSRGYYNDPQETSRAFVEDMKWCPGKKRRFYKTGDLVRLDTETSNLIFICRKDTQIKIRGQRVETSEICNALQSSFGCDGVAVEYLQLGLSKRELVAFCTLNPVEFSKATIVLDMTAEVQERLKRAERELRSTLPSFMVPSIYLPINKIPTTSSGKIDSRHLVNLARATMGHKSSIYRLEASLLGRHPTTNAEIFAAGVWSQVIGIETSLLTTESHFFRVGGDSLSAMRLSAVLFEHGYSVSATKITQYPVLADMALILEDPNLQRGPPRTSHLYKDLIPRVIPLLKDSFKPEDIQDVAMTTPTQDAMMAASTKTVSAYTASYAATLESQVDPQRLQQSWIAVIQENDILRSRIVHLGDLGARLVVLNRSCAKRSSCKINSQMSYGTSLYQIKIYQHNGVWRSLEIAHHAIFDGFSLDLVHTQIYHKYHGSMHGTTIIPFQTFSNEIANSRNESAEKEFWLAQLSQDASTSFYEYTKPKHEQTSRREEKLDWTGSLDCSDQMSVLESQHSSVILSRAAWALTCATYTASERVVHGSVSSGRTGTFAGARNIVGPTLTMVPVAITIDKSLSVQQFLETLNMQYLQMMRFEHTGLQEIERLTGTRLNLSSLLIVQPSHQENLFGNLVQQQEQISTLAEGYYTHDLVLECSYQNEARLDCHARYDGTKIARGEMEQILDTFCALIRSLRNCQAQTTLGSILHQVHGSFKTYQHLNAFNTHSDSSTTVPELFRRQCLKSPHRDAVLAHDGAVTYAQLDQMSTSLASHLLAKGFVKPGEVVPLLFDKSLYVVVAMIAVIKTGCAYTAVDTALPTSRIHLIATQVRSRLFLVGSEAHAERAMGMNVQTVVIDHDVCMSFMKPHGVGTDKPTVLPSNLALIVFTSGSTGSPKPITISNGAFANCVVGFSGDLRLDHLSRVLCNAGFSFDIHACEIFLTLLNGGTLIMSNRDRAELATEIERWQVNWLFSTPSALSIIPSRKTIPSVKTLMMIGEAPAKSVYSTWKSSDFTLINAYGPAENTLFTSLTTVDDANQDTTRIGRPINTNIWVVDADNDLQLLPVGAIGELVLNGSQLSDGYLYDTFQTSLSFAKAPSWAGLEPDAKIYKTGDMCQVLLDGSLRIFGRKDHQVKIRGQRVELGEIEFHMQSAFQGIQVAVEYVRVAVGDQILVGLYERQNTGRTAVEVPTDQLRKLSEAAASHMQSVLPSFMVPAHFFPISRFPSTASGKLDRKQLRALVQALPEDTISQFALDVVSSGDAPHTSMEIILQRLWAKVLGMTMKQIHRDSNFVSLGGNSLTAIKLSALLAQEEDGKIVTVRDMFTHPRLSDMATRIRSGRALDEPSMRSFELIGSQHTALIDQVAQTYNIPPEEIADMYPVTALQKAFMQSTMVNPHAYVSHQQFDIRLPGPDAVTKLQEALASVISDHEILRTILVSTAQGELLQAVLKRVDGAIVVGDSISGYLSDFRHKINLGLPLFRSCIINRNDESHGYLKLVITAHHSIFDRHSMQLLLQEVDLRLQSLPPQKLVSFRYFIRHVRNISLARAERFWKTLTDGSTVSKIFANPGLQASLVRHEKTISRRVELRNAVPRSRLTTAVKGAWALTLGAYAESDDVTFGLILNGRGSDSGVFGLESICGPTVATVPFRVQAPKTQIIGTFLNDLQEFSASAMAYCHFDFTQLKSGQSNRTAVTAFDTVLDITLLDDEQGNDGLIRSKDAFQTSADASYYMHPVTILVEIHGSTALDMTMTYDETVLPNRIACQAIAQTEHLLKQLIHVDQLQETATIGSLSMLTEPEKIQIQTWNKVDPTSEANRKCIHHLVYEAAGRHADKKAVEAWDGSVTYRQLDEFASMLAYHLHAEFGLDKNDRIPICFDKSLWTPIAMLACLKLGAAYVPLDPTHPTGRLCEIAAFAGDGFIMTGRSQFERFDSASFKILVLEEALIRKLNSDRASFEGNATADTIAMVLFTSGSTGMPKGVQLDHTSFCTLASLVGGPMDFTKHQDLRVLQFAAYAFDVSNAETFLTLIYGGTLCIIPDEEKQNSLADAINRLRINWLYLTPSATKLLKPSQVPLLQTLILGGEAGSKDIIQEWAPHVHLVNSFGPCEGGIWPSFAHLDVSSSPLDIGWSGATRLWIVDPDDHDCLTGPIGAVGELILEGPMLATGYLNEPDKTRAAFIPPPKWAESFGATGPFYKCGDLVRYHESHSGTLRYVARRDGQVKLRGQRLDLDDIEHHVKACVGFACDVAPEVVTFVDRSDPYLVVFVCSPECFNPGNIGASDMSAGFKNLTQMLGSITAKLKARLPGYMVPSVFLPLAEMPLTMSGKRDRKTLRSIAAKMRLGDLNLLAKPVSKPIHTENGKLLQRLWAELLGLDRSEIRSFDNFIDMGANSIHAMRLSAACRAAGHQLAVADIIRSETLEEMANYVSNAIETPLDGFQRVHAATAMKDAVRQLAQARLGIDHEAIVAVERAGDFQSHAFFYALLTSRGTDNYLKLTLPKGSSSSRLIGAYQSLVASSPIHRTVFLAYRQQVWQVLLQPDQWVTQIESSPVVANGRAAAEAWIAQDLQKETTQTRALTRGAVFEDANNGLLTFVIAQPHSRNDAWSDHIFVSDLAHLYQGGPISPRPSYIDYVAHLSSRNRAPALAYWTGLLRDSTITPVRTSLYPSYDSIISTTLEQTVPVPKAKGSTTATLLKAAWALVLAQATGRKDIVFGQLVSGRASSYPFVEAISGPLLNIVPVRVIFDGFKTNHDVLTHVQIQHAASVEHEWLGERDIVQHCTDWGSTRFASVVQMQNVSEVSETQLNSGEAWQVELSAIDYDSSDIWILAHPQGESVRVTLCISPLSVSVAVGEALLQQLCDQLQKLADLSAPLVLHGEAPVKLPLEHDHMDTSSSLGLTSSASSNVYTAGVTDPSIQEIVHKVWRPLWQESLLQEQDEQVPYHKISWGPWVAGELALGYQADDYAVTVEDILQHPSMAMQYQLLEMKRAARIVD